LLNNSGQVVGRTVTDENGNYYFGNLPAGTYTVKVDTTTLPGGGGGLTNTVDPDGGTANQSTVVLAAGGVNLLQDFGYRPSGGQPVNSVSGTIWNDSDADGTLEGGEPVRYPNVTVALYADTNNNGILDSADDLVGTTTTDGSGNYAFTNLPNGAYLVDVTDTANVLNGQWKSIGPTPGSDNNSQSDPYPVTLSGGANNTTADFGYYIQPSALGNRVWYDTDGDGIQDGGEGGLIVEVTLKITYPNGTVVNLKTKTDSLGEYRFDNLLLDENFDGNGTPGAGGNEPKYEIIVNGVKFVVEVGDPFASPVRERGHPLPPRT